MKRIFASAAALVASIGMAAPAFAVGFVPSGATWTATGATTMSKGGGAPINCSATFNGVVNASGTITVNGVSFAAGNATCPFLDVTTPFTLTATSTSAATASPIVITSAGTPICSGSVSVSWTNGNGSTTPSSLTFSSALVNPDCVVGGTLTLNNNSVIIQ